MRELLVEAVSGALGSSPAEQQSRRQRSLQRAFLRRGGWEAEVEAVLGLTPKLSLPDRKRLPSKAQRKSRGKRLAVVKWTYSGEAELVPLGLVRRHAPLALLAFYQSRVVWAEADPDVPALALTPPQGEGRLSGGSEMAGEEELTEEEETTDGSEEEETSLEAKGRHLLARLVWEMTPEVEAVHELYSPLRRSPFPSQPVLTTAVSAPRKGTPGPKPRSVSALLRAGKDLPVYVTLRHKERQQEEVMDCQGDADEAAAQGGSAADWSVEEGAAGDQPGLGKILVRKRPALKSLSVRS